LFSKRTWFKMESLSTHLQPVAVAHGLGAQQLQQRQELQEVVDGLAAHLVRLPVAERLGQLLARVLWSWKTTEFE
jgi:hypothetical protein